MQSQDTGERTHCWPSPLPLDNVLEVAVRLKSDGNVKIARNLNLVACGKIVYLEVST